MGGADSHDTPEGQPQNAASMDDDSGSANEADLEAAALEAAIDRDAPLTETDKEMVFKIATRGLVIHYGDQFKSGMTDIELDNALHRVLGIFGGTGAPGMPSTTFTGAGLRIWGGWRVVNHVTEKPLFSGKATLDKARAVYNIKNPDDKQLDLF
ncbi:MAG: hypothetical protein KDJ74_06615 [Notoacmeibacter sp.]|nr:hypothetical protein [Notoacmeibacter sp.]